MSGRRKEIRAAERAVRRAESAFERVGQRLVDSATERAAAALEAAGEDPEARRLAVEALAAMDRERIADLSRDVALAKVRLLHVQGRLDGASGGGLPGEGSPV